jgi:threonylcarbamoyladenosine tRNA methylthiotransferase MtaB
MSNYEVKKRIALQTLGCKLNYAETSMFAEQFTGRGFDIVDAHGPADIYVLNTCSVTERAARECRQVIRRMHRQSPLATIVVVGCYAQLEPAQIASIEGVDLILGSREKFSVIDYLDDLKKTQVPCVQVGCIDDANDFGPAYSTTPASRTRAFLKIQDGCDYTCSYCTIPMARGESRSQDIPKTVLQADMLVRKGFREIVLTGVNVGDFGRKTDSSLLRLLECLETVEGLERIRISSIEPNLLDDDLLGYIRESSKICHHFHIPMQSGHDEILRSMRRRYNVDEFIKLIGSIRRQMPDAGIGVDVIVGFPGESDEYFAETHSLLAELPVSYLHVFSFSERPRTHAVSLPGKVSPWVCTQRRNSLRTLAVKKKQNFYSAHIGQCVKVLVEETTRDGMMEGFTDNYIRVGVPANNLYGNQILPIRLMSYDETRGLCRGKVEIM